ncbi:MAG: Rrf2 family transcriptional regulator [Deltaproteobacteria bacterium]|nr:Rrf2 family transcriptional regulator [Deltaproteobacteria bacterium]
MKLSKKGEYALRALTCLGSPEAPQVLAIQEIARRERIPKKFLEQVLLALKKAGIVQSNRGKAGGYALRGAPAGITLGDIVRAVDGPLAPLPCANPTAPVKCADCPSLEHCWLRAVMTEVGAAVTAALDQVTLAEICRRVAQSQRSRSMHALMYDI